MFKKITAFILTVSVLLSMAVVNVHAEEVSAERVTRFENAVTLLTELGAISESDGIKFESEITRGQFVDILAKIIPVSEGGEEQVFPDVPSTHKYYKVIQGFAESGYIAGTGYNNFEPDRAITYNEALYMLFNTMGYGDFMKLVANYAAGGWEIANKLDLDTKNKGAIAGDIFYLTYQALTADMLAITGMKEGSFIFASDPDKSLLETYHNIDVYTGILQSNGQVSINGQYPAEEGRIVVTDETFKIEEPITVLPGCEVDVFYDIDSAEAVCVVATEENKIIEIDSADIEGFRDMKYDYEVNGVSKTLKIRNGADVVINNVLATEIDEEAMVPANGKIIAIDNGTTTGYAVIYVKSYTSFIVKSVVNDNNITKIFADADSGIGNVIINNEVDVPVVLDAEQKVASVSDITVGTVISVMGNLDADENIIADEIVMANGLVTGDLTTIYRDDPMVLVIDGTKYPVAESAEYIMAGISPQGNMTFYLDFMGNIVALDSENSGGMAYGYILGAKLAYNEEGERVVSVKLLSEIGSIIEYFLCPERIYVDDNRSEKYYDPEETAPELFGGEQISLINKFRNIANGASGRVIRYDVNDEREINKIDFAVSIETASNPTINDRLFLSRPEFAGYLRKSAKTFSTQVSVDENTIVFKIPENPEEAAKTDYEVVRDIAKLTEGRYKIEAYKLGDEAMVSSVIVAKLNFDSYSDSAQYYVVTDIEQTLDEFDEITYNVTLDGGAGAKVYKAKYSSVVETPHALGSTSTPVRQLREGDIVRCIIDATGTTLLDISVCYKGYEKEAVGSTVTSLPNGNWNDLRIAAAKVYAMNDTLISFAAETRITEADGSILGDDKAETYMVDSFKIFKLEVSEAGVEVTPGTKNDIKAYRTSGGLCSDVVFVTQSATGKMLFVIE